jgi:hypothetical protein
MKLLRPTVLAASLLCAAAPARVLAQTSPAAAAVQDGPVRLYLDCSGFYCEGDYYQTEIPFVTHVRDRSDSDVHLLITSQSTASGGVQYTLAFLGQRRFAGENQTLTHVTEAGASQDSRRSGLARVIKLGLVRYAAQSPTAGRLTVSYQAPAQQASAAAARDPWRHWTFRVSGNGFFNGEESYSSRSMFASASASRVTEQWKLSLSSNVSESFSRFEIDDATVFRNTQTSRGANGLVVRSLGRHLSAGATGSVSRSTYFNQDLAVRIAPAVEYNFFPYAESTRRQATLRYSVGPVAYDYSRETIYGKTSETRLDQLLLAGVVARQPWGSVNVSAQAASQVNDLSRNRLNVGGGVELNLIRGLSMNLNGSYERLRDQQYLPAGEATDEEILLRRRQLATGFQYFASVGLSYTFGSRLSPVVNPRFGSSGGGGIVIID